MLNDQPVYMATKTFSAARFPRFEEVYGSDQSVTQVFRAHGVAAYHRLETRVSGGATHEEATALGLSPETPVMRTIAVNSDPDGRPNAFSCGCWPLALVELVLHAKDGTEVSNVPRRTI